MFDPFAMMLPGGAADDRAEHLAGDRANLELLALGRLRRAVAQHHVAHLVRHDAGDLALVLAASIMPRLRNIGPPGSAKALISFWLTTRNV